MNFSLKHSKTFKISKLKHKFRFYTEVKEINNEDVLLLRTYEIANDKPLYPEKLFLKSFELSQKGFDEITPEELSFFFNIGSTVETEINYTRPVDINTSNLDEKDSRILSSNNVEYCEFLPKKNTTSLDSNSYYSLARSMKGENTWGMKTYTINLFNYNSNYDSLVNSSVLDGNFNNSTNKKLTLEKTILNQKEINNLNLSCKEYDKWAIIQSNQEIYLVKLDISFHAGMNGAPSSTHFTGIEIISVNIDGKIKWRKEIKRELFNGTGVLLYHFDSPDYLFLMYANENLIINKNSGEYKIEQNPEVYVGGSLILKKFNNIIYFFYNVESKIKKIGTIEIKRSL